MPTNKYQQTNTNKQTRPSEEDRARKMVLNNIIEWCACARWRELVTPYESLFPA
jgi:hypothetical protein